VAQQIYLDVLMFRQGPQGKQAAGRRCVVSLENEHETRRVKRYATRRTVCSHLETRVLKCRASGVLFTIILRQWFNMRRMTVVYLDFFPSSLITQTRRFESTAKARPYFSYGRKLSYIYHCTGKPCDFSKVKNAVVRSVYCVHNLQPC
jgi:hypothetical protein